MFSSMKIAGTRDMRAIDAKNTKLTKKMSMLGLTAATRSTVSIQLSRVMSLNMVHIEAPRFEKDWATTSSSASQRMLVVTMAETMTTSSTSARSFRVALVARARTTSSSFRKRRARKSRRMRSTRKRRPAEAPEPPLCPQYSMIVSATLMAVIPKSKRFQAISSPSQKNFFAPLARRRMAISTTYRLVKMSSRQQKYGFIISSEM